MSNIIQLPVIGIPGWKWKRKLCRYTRKHQNIINVLVSKELCYECSRHFEMLKIFDENDFLKYEKSEYYLYYKNNKKQHKYIIKKIKEFGLLYRSIQQGYKTKDSPIITDDGCRLDGSHRLSILVHLGVETVDLNMAVCENVFSKKESKSIRKQVKKYRYEVYCL